ncbi:alpha-ketoglutarate-dependent dioxygenase AlkB [Saccharobesus litoralis]|uniref:Alpha-ketoglutarate-dependent dioxygenase AlkB n=2 Tax=Saccharobesus litoralis TaxID=2172099 RepID=A0A2S0VY17_9ALTE|nr:alpha-ketoglutarate-dependent dioxygenase AlkB [Saccharobesus litoralis]
MPWQDSDVYYFPNLFSLSESRHYFRLLESLNWQQETLNLYNREVKTPRLQSFYGDNGVYYTYSGQRFDATEWVQVLSCLKPWLASTCSQVLGRTIQFNAMLGNYYRDGNDNMGWHADDEPELGQEPVIASLNFGAARDFKFKHKFSSQQHNLLLENGSLLIMAGKTQQFWYHSLPKRMRVAEPRINLTFRYLINSPK